MAEFTPIAFLFGGALLAWPPSCDGLPWPHCRNGRYPVRPCSAVLADWTWLAAFVAATAAAPAMIAAVIVTIMLIPQSSAHAMLAGLPPEVGLCASILPIIPCRKDMHGVTGHEYGPMAAWRR